MLHITLDTGDVRESPLDEVDRSTLEKLRYMLTAGEHELPGPFDCTASVTIDGPHAAMVTVFRDHPLVTFGVARDFMGAAKLWMLLDNHKSVPSEPVGRLVPVLPTTVPWCAVRFEVGLAIHQQDAAWLGDFERCWAWAWLTS